MVAYKIEIRKRQEETLRGAGNALQLVKGEDYTWMHTFVKNHQIEHLTFVNFSVAKLFLSDKAHDIFTYPEL